jgi:predicted ATPase
MTEAVAQLRKGLDLLSSVLDGVARHELELDLQITLGQALMAAKGLAAPEAGEVLARARHLCEQLGQQQQLGTVLLGQFQNRIARAELEQTERLADEILLLGESRNDTMWKFFGSMTAGVTCSFIGKFIKARAHLENSLSLWDPMYRDFAGSPDDPRLQTLVFLSRTLFCLGYLDQSRLLLEEALAEAGQLSPYNWAFVQGVAGISATRGHQSAQTMLHSMEELVAISTEQGFPHWVSVGNIVRGWCLGSMGQTSEGISLLLDGIAIRVATRGYIGLVSSLTTLAEVYGMAVQPEEGLKRLAEAAQLMERTNERWADAEMHRVRGALLLSLQDRMAAQESYEQALSVARTQNAKFRELRAALDLARLWRDQGKHTEATDLLAPIYSWFTEGFDTPVLQEAKALLDELA